MTSRRLLQECCITTEAAPSLYRHHVLDCNLGLKALLHIIKICNLLYHWCGFGGGTISVGCINGPYVLLLTALRIVGRIFSDVL